MNHYAKYTKNQLTSSMELCGKTKKQNKIKTERCETGFSPPVKYFTDGSKAVLLLWIFHVFFCLCVCFAFVHDCLYVLCGHLLRKG